MAEIARRLNSKPATTLPRFTDDQIREFLCKESRDFSDALAGDPEVARREIQKRIKNLVITPKQTAHGTMLEVSGDVELLRGGDDVLLGISMEGIPQHYDLSRPFVFNTMVNPQLLPPARICYWHRLQH